MSESQPATPSEVDFEIPKNKGIKMRDKVYAIGDKRAKHFVYPFDKKVKVRGNRGPNITKVSVINK